MAASSTSAMLHQSRCNCKIPDSIAENRSRSSTSRPSRDDSAAILVRKRWVDSASQLTSGWSRLDA